MLNVPNATAATAYSVGSVFVDGQSAGSVARFIVGSGAVQVNSAAFTAPNNVVRFEVPGGILVSDVSQTGTLLVNTPGSVPINVTAGGTFITTSPTFLLQSGEMLGTQGTLFGFNGATVDESDAEWLARSERDDGRVDQCGYRTATIKLDAGETLTLGAAADLSGGDAGLWRHRTRAAATLEVNAPAATVRLGTGTAIDDAVRRVWRNARVQDDGGDFAGGCGGCVERDISAA